MIAALVVFHTQILGKVTKDLNYELDIPCVTINAQKTDSPTVHIRNIGGIDEASLHVSPGVTALVGENATNRTSLLQAIGIALGVDMNALKSDAASGEVALEIGGSTFKRTLNRKNGSIRIDGDPYVSQPAVPELFALLFRSNEIRTAVRENKDIRQYILEPVDTAEIEQRISECLDRRREVDSELDRLDERQERLIELESERTQKESELEEVVAELEEKQSRLESREDSMERAESEIQAALDEKLSELGTRQTELDRVTSNIESERKRLASLEESYDTLQQQHESLSMPDEEEIARLETRIEDLRARKSSVESVIHELQQVIRFNEDRLSDPSTLEHELSNGHDDSQSVTAQLDPSSSTTVCWTCGSEVQEDNIEKMAEKLRDLRQDKLTEKREIADKLDSLSEKLGTLESKRTELADIEEKLPEFEADIEEAESNIEDFEARKAELEAAIDSLETEIEELRVEQQDDMFDLQQEVSTLLSDRERLEAERDRLTERIAEIEDELATREALEAERDELSEELADLRTRIERIEADTVERFNEHMANLIEKLGYSNLERVWMERTEVEVTDGRRNVTESKFEIHVIRHNDDGKAYEDTINNLSESEREIVGLVVALTGYIVHDVHERVPFMLLDSVEMVDGERLADMVSYLEDYVPYLVVVLLPDHARTFEEHPPTEEYNTVHV